MADGGRKVSKKKLLIFGLGTILVVVLVGAGVIVVQNNGNLTNITQQLFSPELATEAGSGQSEPPDTTNTGSQTGNDTSTDQAQQSKGGSKGGPAPGMAGDIAQVLGMSSEELQTELKAGKTLEQIASNKGMTLDQLKCGIQI
jgi:cytoskeletal protein RodZ